MIEILKNWFKPVEDRINHPIMGPFIISFLLANWKSVLELFFSDNNIEERIRCIMTDYSDRYTLFVIPLIGAVFYIVLLPFMRFGLSKFLKGVAEKESNLATEKKIL